MKNDLIDNIINSNNFKKENPNACSICKCEDLPIDLSKKNKYEIKALKSKIKFNETDYSDLIKKCNCTKTNPKAHKLCIILNILYNFDLKCKDCNADYNISITQRRNGTKKCLNICSLICSLFINIAIYGGSAFLILYPLLLNKNTNNDPEKNKMEHVFYCFGGLIFLINTFFIYVTFSSILCNNPDDVNDYLIDIKDINEQNKNKNSDKYFNLLYKFYRYFYKMQIRFLIDKKHKSTYIAKGYGYFNKELKDIIIKNHMECEKEEKDNTLNNGGENILNLNKKKNNKNDKRNDYKAYEQSNGNIDIENKNDLDDVKSLTSLKEEEKKKETENNSSYSPQVKNDNILKNVQNKKKEELEKNDNDLISNNKNGSENKEQQKKVIIEVINTDKCINEKENEKSSLISQKEEMEKKEEKENDINNFSLQKKASKISGSSKKSKKSANSKNIKLTIKLDKNIKEESKNDSNSNNLKGADLNNDQKYIESTELFKNDNNEVKSKNEDNKEKKNDKNELISQPIIFEDNFNIFISSPAHNNGK